MRIFIILVMSTMFAACSSAKKQPEAAQTSPAPVTKNTTQSNNVDSEIVKKESCESAKDFRILEVRKKASGCELLYTKFGKSKTATSSKKGTKHCEDSLDKITKKLEAQKFKCNI